MYLYFLVLSSLVAVNTGIHIPGQFPRCYRTDPLLSGCLLKASYDLKDSLKSGIKEMEIPPLDKIPLEDFELVQITNISNVTVKVFNTIFYNLSNYVITQVEFHPNGILLRGNIEYKVMPYSVDLDMTGTFLGYPATGKRSYQVEAKGVHIAFAIVGDIINNLGVEHCNVEYVDIKAVLEDLSVELDQPPSEKFVLSNEILKEKSKALAKNLGPVLSQVFKVKVKNYLTQLCRDVTYTDLFPYFPY